ncbi:MAG: Na+/H+ antiporter NhaC [Pseudomonadota bacterium]
MVRLSAHIAILTDPRLQPLQNLYRSRFFVHAHYMEKDNDTHGSSSNPRQQADVRWSPALALTPIVVLVILLGGSVYLFGTDSSAGANQIALLLSATIVGLVGLRVGLRWRTVQAGMVEGIALGLNPILILLAVGMLIGTWILSGTVPAMIYYGVEVLDPNVFYAASAVLCAVVAISIGSSWTVAGTLGIGLMGIGLTFEMSPAITAASIICGAYFGDKLSPLSETTNLAAAVTSVDLFDHIRHMLWTTIPAFVITIGIFVFLGDKPTATEAEIEELQQALRAQFEISPILLLPLLLMLLLVVKRVPAFPAIVISALTGAVFALVFQHDVITQFVDEPNSHTTLVFIKGIWMSLIDGYQSSSGNELLDDLLSKGGMSSMLFTVWLIICALAFGGALERSGILGYMLDGTLRRVNGHGPLIATTVGTCISTNVLTADQYISVALPGRMFTQSYKRLGLSPLNLSRTLEDSGTITSVLIPWNTCGAYMSATLGIATLEYAPYAFFNFLCPIIAIVYGFIGFALKPTDGAADGSDTYDRPTGTVGSS